MNWKGRRLPHFWCEGASGCDSPTLVAWAVHVISMSPWWGQTQFFPVNRFPGASLTKCRTFVTGTLNPAVLKKWKEVVYLQTHVRGDDVNWNGHFVSWFSQCVVNLFAFACSTLCKTPDIQSYKPVPKIGHPNPRDTWWNHNDVTVPSLVWWLGLGESCGIIPQWWLNIWWVRIHSSWMGCSSVFALFYQLVPDPKPKRFHRNNVWLRLGTVLQDSLRGARVDARAGVQGDEKVTSTLVEVTRHDAYRSQDMILSNPLVAPTQL